MQKQNPLLRVWELGKSQHSGLICAVISAFLGVLGGMLPYFAAAQMIVNLLEGNRDMSLYFKWLCIGMVGYLVRTLLYTLALSSLPGSRPAHPKRWNSCMLRHSR